jgi:hypothetical protein
MPISVFARSGMTAEILVTWLSQPIWFSADELTAEHLSRQGVSRGRIWTAAELADLLAISNITPAGAQTVARAKLEFDGEISEVRRR